MAAVKPKKVPKFPPAQLDTAPIVFSSTHGVYYVTPEMAPFEVPAKTYIFETQWIGDLCLTSIDSPLWDLIQSAHRNIFKSYLTADYNPATLDDDTRELAGVIPYLNYYEPGDMIFNRQLSIGGGRGPAGSSRIAYANMGFYYFPVNTSVEPDIYPHGPKSKIFGELRTSLITNQYKNLSYKDFIEYTYTHRPDLAESGAIFIFSCCAEARKLEGTNPQFDRKIYEIETVQQRQHQKFLAYTPAAAGGPLDVEVAPAGAEGGVNARIARKQTLRGMEGMHSSAFDEKQMNSSHRQLANVEWASREVPSTHEEVPPQPAGTRIMFRVMKDGHYKQLFIGGDMYLTDATIADYKKKHPKAVLKEFIGGEFKNLAGGGRRKTRRKTRRRRS
jgi:hypothetical protein